MQPAYAREMPLPPAVKVLKKSKPNKPYRKIQHLTMDISGIFIKHYKGDQKLSYSSVVSLLFSPPSIVLQYADANPMMICSSSCGYSTNIQTTCCKLILSATTLKINLLAKQLPVHVVNQLQKKKLTTTEWQKLNIKNTSINVLLCWKPDRRLFLLRLSG